MGAWSHEPFGNDDAGDWVYALEGSKDFSLIEETLDAIAEHVEGYLEAPQCCEALAAAEVVAALRGKPADWLSDEVATWVVGKPQPSAALVKKARHATAAVLKSSELQQLWEESEDYGQWQAATRDLEARLD